MKSRMNENRKVTLTIGQLKRLVRESIQNDENFEIEGDVLVAYNGEGGDVVVPDSVTNIGSSAFYNCNGLTSVTIPDSVTSIWDRAFLGCTSLASIDIPNSVTSIEEWAFKGCTSLTSVTIGTGITSISKGMFSTCRSLESVTIPASVTNIDFQAFEDCRSLVSVTIPDSVRTIGISAFSHCFNLTSVTILGKDTRIEWMAFSHCRKLKTIYVSNEVQKEMILNGDNKLSAKVRIIVKGEESDDDGFLVREADVDMDMDKDVWEGWTVSDFIHELEPQLDMIMTGGSWKQPFKTKRELQDWCKDNQPYYKKNIPGVVKYFAQKYNLN